MFQIKDADKKKALVRAGIAVLIGAVLSLIVIMPLRGVMNAVSRINFIAQRLDDYPRMYAGYLEETEEWWNWWLTEDYQKRAEQGAMIFDLDGKYKVEGQKLSYIAKTLGAEKVQIVSEAEYERMQAQDQREGWSICSAPLKDGRLLVLTFQDSLKDDRMAFVDDPDYFMSQVQAGLLGYIVILHEGKLSIYPKDENEAPILEMIQGMLDNGKLNREALLASARTAGERTALKTALNQKTAEIPGGKYVLYSAAYEDNSDFVINVAEVSDLVRFGRKRSWSLWFLCCAVMVLLVKCLWNTKLYVPGEAPEEENITAAKRSFSAVFMTGALILGSVIVIQMLSSVNLSQQGATDQAAFVKKVLGMEAERASSIEHDFDAMYGARARTASSVLSDNPQLMEVDSLHRLCQVLDGSGIRVFDKDGICLASDEVLHQTVDESLTEVNITGGKQDEEEEEPVRYYRAPLTDTEGKTIGWVELLAAQSQLDGLLRNTHLSEVIGDLHLLDSLHVVVVEGGEDGKVVAGTWKNWVGDKAGEHGIQTQLLFDGYEGIISFEGNKCYSIVFSYGDYYVIVGSEDETLLVFAGGVAMLSILLILIAILTVYHPLTRHFCQYQKQKVLSEPDNKELLEKSEYPELWVFLRDFMVALFMLTAVLFFSTKGNPAGLTYNIVRGTWIRGVNAATITTSIMLTSVVFAAQRLIDMFLLRLGKYLSPKGMTICRLLDSCLAYVGAIVMIIYALSMFGVNTATLIGGVGVTAVLFTLGTNSLLGDVVAGIFIIFEGDFTVGDVVVIDNFRGIVTDIGMRTTKLMDDNSRDIKIVNNSEIKTLVNQSREKSSVTIDIPVSRSFGLSRGEVVLKEEIAKLPKMFPKILSTPEYWGISEMPMESPYTGKYGGCKARIAFDCWEKDKEMLTYQVYRQLVFLVVELNNLESADKSALPANGPEPAKAAEPANAAAQANAPEQAKPAEPDKI